MFKYQGPVDSSVTLKVDGQDRDVVLFRGQTVDLPEEHDYVQTLVALGHLVPTAATTPSKAVTVEAAAAAESETAKKGAK
jgi:hypothetical protein